MKIKQIEIFTLQLPQKPMPNLARRPAWSEDAEVANPMSRYDRFKRHRKLWRPFHWPELWCKVTLDDGSWGLGSTPHAPAVAPLIADFLGPILIGEDGFAIERLNDMMRRLTVEFGSGGLSAHAISAIDLALWDVKGKVLNRPVHTLIGGPTKEKIPTYCTGNDIDWYQELGFRAFKLACPYGPADGIEGMEKNEALVAETRAKIGDGCDLMLDCWMAFDVDYAVRLAERLRPYKLRWIEECLPPENLDSWLELRQRLPWQTITAGEHWFNVETFMWALKRNVADVYQPDINWCGGLTSCIKIANLVEAAGKSIILHTGGYTAFGQQFTAATPAAPWIEYYIGSPPGVPLHYATKTPDLPVPIDGWLKPAGTPGFGLNIKENWLKPYNT